MPVLPRDLHPTGSGSAAVRVRSEFLHQHLPDDSGLDSRRDPRVVRDFAPREDQGRPHLETRPSTCRHGRWSTAYGPEEEKMVDSIKSYQCQACDGLID
jgi:hypothetical protein